MDTSTGNGNTFTRSIVPVNQAGEPLLAEGASVTVSIPSGLTNREVTYYLIGDAEVLKTYASAGVASPSWVQVTDKFMQGKTNELVFTGKGVPKTATATATTPTAAAPVARRNATTVKSAAPPAPMTREQVLARKVQAYVATGDFTQEEAQDMVHARFAKAESALLDALQPYAEAYRDLTSATNELEQMRTRIAELETECAAYREQVAPATAMTDAFAAAWGVA